MNDLVYPPLGEVVARTIVGSKAYLISRDMANRDRWFRWKSQVEAPVYTDCRVLAGDPGATAIVVAGLASGIRHYYPSAELIVGMAEAGVVWSSLVAAELGLPQAFVRKQRKAHGTSALVECAPASGAKAVLVDDLMASGRSIEGARDALRTEYAIDCIGVMTIVNWNFSHMRELMARLGLAHHSLVSFPELLDEAVRIGELNDRAARELDRFYRNPEVHSWSLGELDEQESA